MSEIAFIQPDPESIFYEDKFLYICLAQFPLTRGHSVVVWKDNVSDLHDLSDTQYQYLMKYMDVTRDVLLEVCKVEKVYLLYMDEAKHVHWHLVPRYDEKGFNVLEHVPSKTSDFSLALPLKHALEVALREN